MTTYIPFTPSATAAPPFQSAVALDGATYNLSVTWNLMGRWYLSLSDQSGNVIYMGALVGSPPDSDILLAPGIFETSTLLYRAATQNFEIKP